MLVSVGLTVLMGFSSGLDSIGVAVARFADLPDVFLSPVIADTPATQWAELDRKVNESPWARELLNRRDLIGGWLEAFKACPAPEKQQMGTRFQNLESLLSYPPFKAKEAGCEREILIAVVGRRQEAKSPLPEGACVRLARAAFPDSKMAHLYDGVSVQGDGVFLMFSGKQAVRRFEAKRAAAESQLVELINKL